MSIIYNNNNTNNNNNYIYLFLIQRVHTKVIVSIPSKHMNWSNV